MPQVCQGCCQQHSQEPAGRESGGGATADTGEEDGTNKRLVPGVEKIKRELRKLGYELVHPMGGGRWAVKKGGHLQLSPELSTFWKKNE